MKPAFFLSHLLYRGILMTAAVLGVWQSLCEQYCSSLEFYDCSESLQKSGAAVASWKTGVGFMKTVKAIGSRICRMSCVTDV